MESILEKDSEPDPNQRLAQELLAQAGGTTTKHSTKREIKAVMKIQQAIRKALNKGAPAMVEANNAPSNDQRSETEKAEKAKQEKAEKEKQDRAIAEKAAWDAVQNERKVMEDDLKEKQ